MSYLPRQGILTFVPDVFDHFNVVDSDAHSFRPRHLYAIRCADKLLPSLTIFPATDRVYAC